MCVCVQYVYVVQKTEIGKPSARQRETERESKQDIFQQDIKST